MERIRKHFIFSGRVQGVGFRWRSSQIAASLGLTGWVKNQWDSTVELEIQGTREEIGKFLSMLYQQRYIQIEDVQTKEIPLETDSGFHIR